MKCHCNTVIVKLDLSQEIVLHFVYSLKGITAEITLWQPFSWTQLLGVWQEVLPTYSSSKFTDGMADSFRFSPPFHLQYSTVCSHPV